uniref:WHIM1 domain-containing protein n=1 Tax=Peronospora matthiolae TaxID=2874970 RepID=A0AAV1U3K4_9STRA
MVPGDARKRVSPPSFESNGGKRSVRKRKTMRKDAGDAGVTLRSGARETEDCKLDSIKTGEDVSSSSFRTKRGVTRDLDNDSRNVETAATEDSDEQETEMRNGVHSRRNAVAKSVSTEPATKRLQRTAKVKMQPKTPVSVKPKAKLVSKAAPKRKARTQDDKVKENAPLVMPFFVETGAEWNNTNVDFDELSTLRSQWELLAACHILWLLQSPLTLHFSDTLLEYEAALLKPEASPVLEDVFTKLLLKKSERACLSAGIGLKYEWWNKQLRVYYLDMYDKWYALLRKAGERLPGSFSQDEDDDDSDVSNSETDEQVEDELTEDEWLTLDILKARLETLGVVCPLKHQSFADLSIELRCKILLNLCEAVIDDPSNTEYMRQMEDDDLRVEPLGNDRAGNLYYFFPQFYEERRLYRLDPETRQWALWAKGDDAFHSMFKAMKSIGGRKIRGEQELLDHLEVIIEQIEDEAAARARQMEKANRLAILEAIPRKRSLRLQVKQLVQMEKHQEELKHLKDLSMEEIAAMKQMESLDKAERGDEKEVRDAEREARRLHRDQVEYEGIVAARKSPPI